MEMIYLQRRGPRTGDTVDDKCMFYYATAQRTHVCVHTLLLCGRLPLILHVSSFFFFFCSIQHQLLHYSTFIHHPFICTLVCRALPSSLRLLSSLYSSTTFCPAALTQARYFTLQTPYSSMFSLNLSPRFFSALEAPLCKFSLSAITPHLQSTHFISVPSNFLIFFSANADNPKVTKIATEFSKPNLRTCLNVLKMVQLLQKVDGS